MLSSTTDMITQKVADPAPSEFQSHMDGTGDGTAPAVSALVRCGRLALLRVRWFRTGRPLRS